MVAWEGNKFGVSVWGVQSLAAAYMRHAFPLGYKATASSSKQPMHRVATVQTKPHLLSLCAGMPSTL